MILDLVFMGVIFGITNNHSVGAKACSYKMWIWHMVFAGYLGAQFLYDLYYTIVFGYIKRTTEVTRALSDFVMTCILYGFGLSWLVWGNVLVYN